MLLCFVQRREEAAKKAEKPSEPGGEAIFFDALVGSTIGTHCLACFSG
jgi:hypothetical protein